MKRLVCFFDGTWNKPEDADQTNVVKLQRAVLAADAGGIAQVVHYEVGIATESALGQWTFAVGAIGFGVGSRIQGGYRFLCENYEAGDEIYPHRLLARSIPGTQPRRADRARPASAAPLPRKPSPTHGITTSSNKLAPTLRG